MKSYLFEYQKDGRTYCLFVEANSESHAKCIAMTQKPAAVYCGEVRESMPFSAGLLVMLKVWFLNLIGRRTMSNPWCKNFGCDRSESPAENKRFRTKNQRLPPNGYTCWVECWSCAAVAALDDVRGGR